MDHTEAIRIKATEQYLLGELSGNLRDEFEEHFMECGDCGRNVRAGAAFFSNAKDALSVESAAAIKRPASQKSWLAAFFRPAVAIPALVVLLAIVSFQNLVVIPKMQSTLSKANTPRSIASFSLLNGSSRGVPVSIAVKREEPFTLYVDVPPQPAFPLYTLDIEDANGAPTFSVSVSAEEARNSVQVLVPPGRLAPGDYLMLIQGSLSRVNSQSSEVGRLRFSVRYAD
jgi:hypothetical protein